MPYTLRASDLPRLLAALSLSLPPESEKIFFFGVRGAKPGDSTDRGQLITLDGSQPLSYTTMRCTIGQWWPSENRIAGYLGSTVPTQKYVESAADRAGQGANQCFPGLYTFTRGQHRAGTATGHAAFRELSPKVICRTGDDGIYEPDTDKVEIDSPADNLHAAWGTEGYSSAGCQVVSGKPGEGSWGIFKERGYKEALGSYRYLLLPSGTWAQLIGTSEPAIINGSRGDRAKAVQEKLIERGLLAETADGQFGPQSTLALLKFQRQRSELAASAICTSSVAGLLGIKDW